MISNLQEIPPNWIKVRFDEIAENITDRIEKPNESGLEYYIGLEHLDTDQIRIKRFGSTDDVNATKFLCKKGDIIFGKRRSYLRKVAVSDRNAVVSAHSMVIRPIGDLIIPDFLPCFMQSSIFWKTAHAISEGSMSPTIKWKTLAKQEFWIPSTEEQTKIARVLWAIEDNAEKIEKVSSLLLLFNSNSISDILKINLIYKNHIEPDISMLPDDWNIVKISDIVTSSKSGFASGARDENGIVQIRMNNVSRAGKIDLTDHLKVPIPKNIKQYGLIEGDLLFNNTNSIDLVGKSAIFYGAPYPCTYSNHFTRLRFNPEKAIPEYILYHIITYQKAGYFECMANRHVGQSGVNLNDLLNIRIPLPPLTKQQEIIDNIKSIEHEIELLKANSQNLYCLKKKLTDEFLSGKLKIPQEALQNVQ